MRGIFSSVSKIIITIFIFPMVFQGTMGSDNDLIQISCKKASDGDPNLSYNFCVASLEAYSKGHTHTKLEELVVISLDMSISNGTNINSTISKLLKDKHCFENNKYAKDCLQSCLELYSDAIPTLEEAIFAFRSGDFGKANVEISSAMDASSTCEDGFKEKKGQVSPLTKENDAFFQLNVMSLAFINTLSS